MDPLLAITLRALMTHTDWVRYRSIIDEDVFPNTTAAAIYEVLRMLHTKYKRNVSERVLRARITAGYKLKRRDKMLNAVDYIMDVEEEDLESIEDTIRQYAARELVLKASGYIVSRVGGPTLDYTHAADMVNAAKAVALGELSDRVESRDAGLPGDEDMVRHAIALGLHPELDALLHGGIGIGELLLFLAPFSGGKTSYLYRLATNWVQAGEGVLCFTKEIAPYKCWNRYYQGLTGLTSTEMLTAHDLIDTARNDVPGSIWMENYCSRKLTPAIVKSIGEDMLSKDEPLTSIIIDYMQICTPNRSGYKQRKDEALSEMVVDFREVANYLGVRMGSAWQVNREGYGKDTFKADNIALSWDATQHADVLIGLNQSEDERRNNYMRAKLMKQREDPDLPMFELHSDMRRLIIGPWLKRKEAVDDNLGSRRRSGVRNNRGGSTKKRRAGGVRS